MEQLTLGKRIAYLRKQRNMTQDDLAEKLLVSPQAVSKWENDQSCPDIALLPELAKELGTTVDYLLSGDQGPATQLVSDEKRKPVEEMLLKMVVDSSDGDKVRINLPVVLVKAFLEMGAVAENIGFSTNKEIFNNINFEQIIRLVECGVMGKLLEVDSSDGDRVEIWVE